MAFIFTCKILICQLLFTRKSFNERFIGNETYARTHHTHTHAHTRISPRVIARLRAKQKEFNYLAIFRSGKTTFEKVSRDKHTRACTRTHKHTVLPS